MTDGKQKILAAAVEIIEQHGELALRIQDVAALSGVAATSIYHHFNDCDGLIMAAQAERFRLTLAETVPPFAVAIRNTTSPEEMREAFVGMLRLYFGDPDRKMRRLSRMNAFASAQHRPGQMCYVNEASREMVHEFAAAFEPAREKGWVPHDLDLEMALAWYFGTITGRALVEHWATPEQLEAWDEVMINSVMSLLFGGDANGGTTA